MNIPSIKVQNCGQCANCGDYHIEWNDSGQYYDVCGKCLIRGQAVDLSDSCSDFEDVNNEDDH